MTAQQLLERVRSDDLARLRWLLCRMFHVAPWSALGRGLRDEDCLVLAAQLVLDRQETAAQGETGNPNFDVETFRKRKGAGV